MDMAAHMLWVGAALVALARRRRRSAELADTAARSWPFPTLGRRLVAVTLLFAILPDLVHLLPVMLWALMDGDWSGPLAYVMAGPGQEPDMPAWASQTSHHLHCLFHSGLVLLGLHLCMLMLWRKRDRVTGPSTGLPWRLALPLWAWWSHVLLDVLTHSDDFYPSPVLYPVTYAGFDGVAWNRPDFMLLNYVALSLTWAWLFRAWCKPKR